jgi:isoamylase
VAGFPVLWAEQNDRYSDTIRDFWHGALRPRVEFARRLTGSTELYQSDGGAPRTGINFVTWHDGFTLHDLVSYGRKHNEANGFDNRDGSDDNRSWNCGVEGPSDNREIIELRERQKRNFLTTLLLSAGVPLLLAGDERGRTQRGNNNAYCQDNETSWVDWGLDEPRTALLEFTKHLIALRAAHPVFRRPKFYQGQEIRGSGVKDITWFTPDGAQMEDTKIWEPDIHTLGMFLNGEEIFHSGLWQRIVDDSFLLVLHAGSRPTAFTLPGAPYATQYELIIDTGHPPARAGDAPSRVVKAGNAIQIEARTMVVLRARWPDE